jgi:hypothetical protein
MSRQRVAFAVLLLITALIPRRCQAERIPWSYQWNAQPIVIDADPLGPHQKPTGGITLTPGAIAITGGNPGVAWGSSNIIAVNLTAFTFSPSPDGKPYSFTNSPYQLGVTLTDVDSKSSGTLNFAGVFYGSLTDTKVDVNTRFTSAIRQALTLGHHRYTVSLTSFSPPGPPVQGGAGEIRASVLVQPVSAPEPSTLVLALIGSAAAACAPRRKRALP